MASGEKNKIIIGIDEAGRGPLAGPVIAAAMTIRQFSIFPSTLMVSGPKGNFQFSKNFQKIKDSKKLSPKKREEIYNFLKNRQDVFWGVGRVGERVIDKINIFEATKLAMIRAVNNLKSKIQTSDTEFFGAKRQNLLLLIDGNFGIDLDIPQKSVVKGDEKIQIISLASIVAKVTRDRIMIGAHKKFPQYGFLQHKGYGTKMHIEKIKKHGPCEIHRKTFKPISKLLQHRF